MNIVIEKVFIKNTFGFKDFPKYLSNYDEITLIGLCTDICVISNAILIKAFYPEKDIKVEEHLCAGTTIENHNAAISVMKSCHIAIVLNNVQFSFCQKYAFCQILY